MTKIWLQPGGFGHRRWQTLSQRPHVPQSHDARGRNRLAFTPWKRFPQPFHPPPQYPWKPGWLQGSQSHSLHHLPAGKARAPCARVLI